MSIVTFYSYKGGVGRSMALANIAVLLARKGRRVLAVDWDLEAPGLEKYFGYFEIEPRPGLLQLFMHAKHGTPDYREYVSTVHAGTSAPLDLLSSGREQDPNYSRNLEAFDWDLFFSQHDGGQFIEDLRQRWTEDYDFVLIDSRTGLSDSGGICTIQLPDIVIAMFTANQQSLYGVRDVMQLAQKARQGLAYDRMALSILPLASRWGDSEFQETQVWLDRVAEGVNDFLQEWLPKGVNARSAMERLKIPHQSFFSFGERLAVVEQGTSDPGSMGAAYLRIADFLENDFTHPELLLGSSAVLQSPALDSTSNWSVPPPPVPSPSPSASPAGDYLYDVFVSHESSVSEWVLEFVDSLKQELNIIRPGASIFLDVREVQSGDLWQTVLRDRLSRSKLLVPILTPGYLKSEWLAAELNAFLQRERRTHDGLIVPVLLRGEGLPKSHPAGAIQYHDMSDAPLRKSRRSIDSQWIAKIRTLARDLNSRLDQVPAYDPAWAASFEPKSVPGSLEPPSLMA